MRRYILMFILSVCVANAADDGKKEGLGIGIMFGPAIPSESIADIYDLADDDLGSAYETAANLGYDIGAKLRFGLSESFSFSGGLTFCSFPNQALILTDQAGNKYELQTTTNIIPVYAGIAWLPVHSVVTPFLGAHAVYSYRSTTVSDGNVIKDILSPGQEIEPQVSRFGALLNAGIEFNLGITPFIDFAYCWSNLAGNDEGEATRAFLTVNVGLMF